MPWAFFQKLPLIDQALPVRFAMYSFLVAAIMGAMYLSDSEIRLWARILLVALTVFFLWPAETPMSKVDTPEFFVSGVYRQYLAKGDTVLILPFANAGNSLLWQARHVFSNDRRLLGPATIRGHLLVGRGRFTYSSPDPRFY